MRTRVTPYSDRSATTWHRTIRLHQCRVELPSSSPSSSKGDPVTWRGNTRPPLNNQDVVPHTESGPFPAWLGVGGSPESVIRAARYGFSLMLAIIGGPPARFAPFSHLFGQALERFGRSARPVGVHGPGHVD